MTGTSASPSTPTHADGTNRKENITDWALSGSAKQYGDATITQVGHLPLRLRRPAPPGLSGEVRREPEARVAAHPVRSGFPRLRRGRQGTGAAARRLRDARAVAARMASSRPASRYLSRRATRCGCRKDKTALPVNPSLTLAGIPPEVFEYRLGNRSALEWVDRPVPGERGRAQRESARTPTARTTPSTSCGWSAKWCASAWRRSGWSGRCRISIPGSRRQAREWEQDREEPRREQRKHRSRR